jgi:uncharacterized delta-60 repeat protein
MCRKTSSAALVAIMLLTGTWVLARVQSGTCSGPGCPDPTFGPSTVLDVVSGTMVSADGIVTTPSIGQTIGAIAVQVIDGEERIVAVNTDYNAWRLARYRPASDGRVALDPTFGNLGVVTKTARGVVFARGIVVQPDSKLVVVGGVASNSRANPVLTVVRYMPNGQYDTTFGAGGTVTLSGYEGEWRGPCLQADGKIVLASGVSGGLSDSRVIRLEPEPGPDGEPAGRLDESFGAGGVAPLPGVGLANFLALQRVTTSPGVWEEKIVVGTSVFPPAPAHSYGSVVRVNADGSRDWTFANGSGAAAMAVGANSTALSDVAIDDFGRIVVVGHFSYPLANGDLDWNMLVARYDAGGVLDPNFGTDGTFTREPGMEPQSVAIDASGRILVAGLMRPKARGLIAWRLLDDGAPDLAFGTGGLMENGTLTPGFYGRPHLAFVESDSAFLVGGFAYVKQSKKALTDVGALGRFLY